MVYDYMKTVKIQLDEMRYVYSINYIRLLIYIFSKLEYKKTVMLYEMSFNKSE